MYYILSVTDDVVSCCMPNTECIWTQNKLSFSQYTFIYQLHLFYTCFLLTKSKRNSDSATGESVVLFINHHVWQMMWRQHVLESHTTPHRWSHNTFTSHLNNQRSSWQPEVTWMTYVKLYIIFVIVHRHCTHKATFCSSALSVLCCIIVIIIDGRIAA